MKKCGWHVSEAYEILEEYSQLRELSKYEIEIMRIILAFPQKLWRIVNKYYNTRRSWCEKSCLIKLAEIESENEIIDKFLKEFIF
jgi:spore coat protein I